MEFYKTNKHLCHRPKDVFSDFRPFIRPLSGMKQMGLLQKGDKKVFLMGEIHQHNFCRELGYVPIAEVVEDFLLGGDHVDFMLESDSSLYYDMHDHKKVRELARSETNMATLADLGSRHGEKKLDDENVVDIIHLTRSIVLPYIYNSHKYHALPNARAHWLEPHIHDNSIYDLKSGDSLQYWFRKFTEAKSLKNVYMEVTATEEEIAVNQQNIKDFTDKINTILRTSKTYPSPSFIKKVPPATNRTLFYTNAFSEATRDEKLIFLDICIEKLLGSRFFKKCKSQARFFDRQVYRDIFWSAWEGTDLKTVEDFYYYVQRFFMDVYTCCRIMKNEDVWFKKIAIYAGNFHVENYIRLLKAVGFTYHPVPNIEFNPTCKYGREYTDFYGNVSEGYNLDQDDDDFYNDNEYDDEN